MVRFPSTPSLCVGCASIRPPGRAKDEIDGLDGDPFLNAEDPCDAYSVQSVSTAGRALRVSVLGHGGCTVHERPDVVVEIGRRAGRWTILQFRDPSRHSDGVIPLLKHLHPKGSTGALR